MKIGKEHKLNKENDTKAGKNDRKSKKGYVQDTVVGINTTITGDLISEKSIRIDGKVFGNVKSEYKIMIGEKAVVKGNICGEIVTLFGVVEGDVEATKILEIMSTGKLQGDVKVNAIAIEEGGEFYGSSKMNGNMSNKG